MILHQLEVRPGAVVVESGTGSGSLSHYFLRALKPTGRLHTFDFHEARADQARDEFKRHGLGDYVTVYHRDVCNLGFTSELDGVADAVFLDLPAPDLAVPHAFKALKLSGKWNATAQSIAWQQVVNALWRVADCSQQASKEALARQVTQATGHSNQGWLAWSVSCLSCLDHWMRYCLTLNAAAFGSWRAQETHWPVLSLISGSDFAAL